MNEIKEYTMAKIDKGLYKNLQRNKKAYFNYEIVDSLEVGMSLSGTEVKSMRECRFSFTDSYVVIENGQLMLMQFTIQPYKQGSIYNHIPLEIMQETKQCLSYRFSRSISSYSQACNCHLTSLKAVTS